MVETTSPTESPGITRPSTSNRSRAQIWAEGSLAQHPYHVELTGSPNELSWPTVCANCGQSATEQILVKKAFRPRPRRRGGSPAFMRPYRIAGAPIPFCATCAAEHRGTLKALTGVEKVMSIFINPLIIPAVGSAWLGWMLLKGVNGASIATPEGKLGWSLTAMVVFGFFWTVFLMWQTTRRDRIDLQTEITLACDFSEDVSFAFEKERRIYALRNKAFAEAFAMFNKDRVWTEADQSRSMKRSFVVSVLFLLALGGIVAVLTMTGRL